MFALVITLISIALVAALALATLYFGGTNWTRGGAAAAAATATNQGEQIRAAMALYRLDHGRYPANLAELEGVYLRVIPVPPDSVAQLEKTFITPAHAGERVWTMLAAHQPAVMIHEKVALDVCQEMNFLSHGSNAIYEKVDPHHAVQCFGPAEGPFTYVVGVPDDMDAETSLGQAVEQYNETNVSTPLAVVTEAEPDNPVTVPESRSRFVSPPVTAPSGPIYAQAVWKHATTCPESPNVYAWTSMLELKDCALTEARRLYGSTYDVVSAIWSYANEEVDPENDPRFTQSVAVNLLYYFVPKNGNSPFWSNGGSATRSWRCPDELYAIGDGLNWECKDARSALGGFYYYSWNAGTQGPHFASPAEMDAFAIAWWPHMSLLPGRFEGQVYKVCSVSQTWFCHSFSPTNEPMPEPDES